MATAEEFESALVAKDLELLADFVADVIVVGMQLREFLLVVVDVGQPKLGLVKRPDDVKDVAGPTAL